MNSMLGLFCTFLELKHEVFELVEIPLKLKGYDLCGLFGGQGIGIVGGRFDGASLMGTRLGFPWW